MEISSGGLLAGAESQGHQASATKIQQFLGLSSEKEWRFLRMGNIWRMNIDWQQRQIGDSDIFPQFTPGGKSLIYQSSSSGKMRVVKRGQNRADSELVVVK